MHVFFIIHWWVISLVYFNQTLGLNDLEFEMVGANLFSVPFIPKDSVSVDLSLNSIKMAKAKDFAGLDHLQNLVFANNLLTYVPKLTHVADTLIYLDLSYNSISNVNEEDFEGFMVLQELSLYWNDLRSVPNLTHIAPGLVKLDISKNKLFHISDDYFTAFTALQELRLIDVHISNVPDLNPLSQTLQSLNIRKNKFNDIPSDQIKKLTHLTHFDFGYNKLLVKIPTLNFIAETFEYISVVDCNITGIIPVETFQGFNSLQMINISKNYITEFPDFKYVAQTLKHLRMSDNLIRHVPIDLLDQLVVLEYLHLGNNKLKHFFPTTGPAVSIRNIRLNNNNLTLLPVISKMSVNLELYRVYDNPITEIPPESFVFLNRNQSVPLNFWLWDTLVETIPPIVGPNINNVTLLADNVPLVCDVRIAWLVLLPEATKGTLEGSCHMPPELQGIALKNLTMEDIKVTGKEQEDKAFVYSHGKLLVKDVYSNTLPMLTVFTPSVHKCVHLCARVQGCLYINYYKELTDIMEGHTSEHLMKGGNCHYAAPYEGTKYEKPDDATGWKYYHIK